MDKRPIAASIPVSFPEIAGIPAFSGTLDRMGKNQFARRSEEPWNAADPLFMGLESGQRESNSHFLTPLGSRSALREEKTVSVPGILAGHRSGAITDKSGRPRVAISTKQNQQNN